MSKQTEALKLALEALEEIALAGMSPAPEMIDSKEAFHARQAWRFIGIAARQLSAIREALAEQPAQQQKEGFASPGGGYVPAIPRPMPLDWKLVPRKATPEMLKAMDECAQEGYDERLYAGMASSVYMAAWDASPVMGTLPEQPAQQQEPVAWVCEASSSDEKHAIDYWPGDMDDLPVGTKLYTSPPASKPLTDEQIAHATAPVFMGGSPSLTAIARAIEATHGIKENT